MADVTRGIYAKFRAERTDPESQQRHKDCRVFVLEPLHDPHARPALAAYAAHCAEGVPELSSDINRWLNNLVGVDSDRPSLVHLIDDDKGTTSCCGRTPFDLPRTDRITSDPALAYGCTEVRTATAFDRCQTAKGWGECVLADGHETREQSEVGARPMENHVDRWGRIWGVAQGGN